VAAVLRLFPHVLTEEVFSLLLFRGEPVPIVEGRYSLKKNFVARWFAFLRERERARRHGCAMKADRDEGIRGWSLQQPEDAGRVCFPLTRIKGGCHDFNRYELFSGDV